MPDNKVPARPGLDQPLGFVMEKGMKKRHIVLGQKVKVRQTNKNLMLAAFVKYILQISFQLAEASDEEYLLSDSSLQVQYQLHITLPHFTSPLLT